MLKALLVFIFIFIAAYLVMGMGASRRRKRLKERLEPYSAAPPHEKKDSSDGHRPNLFAALDNAMRTFSVAMHIRRSLKRANLSMKVSEFILFIVLSGAFFSLATFLLTEKKTPSLFMGAVGASIPFLCLRTLQNARRKRFDGQLLDAITLISNSLKSGYSFMQSMDLVTHELPPPISEEFLKVIQETKLGLPFEKAVQGLIDRVANEDLDLVMTSVMIQREVGGNLSEVLDKIAYTIRERIRIKGQVRTLSAQGRLSGIILSLLPACLGAILYMMTPDYIGLLFTHPLGRIMLVFAVVMQLIGLMMIRKIVNIKV